MRKDESIAPAGTFVRQLPNGRVVTQPERRASTMRLPRYSREEVIGFRERLMQSGLDEHGALAARLASPA